MAHKKWSGRTHKTEKRPLTDRQRIAKLERENKKLVKKLTDLRERVSCLYDWYIRQDNMY